MSAVVGSLIKTRLLLDRGVDINSRDNIGLTPLLSAAISGHTAVVELLLERGADVNARTEKGFTPLKLADDSKRVRF